MRAARLAVAVLLTLGGFSVAVATVRSAAVAALHPPWLLHVAPGDSADAVFRPIEAGPGLPANAVRGSDAMRDDGPPWLDPHAWYESAPLPFTISNAGAEVSAAPEPDCRLQIVDGEGARTWPVESGARVGPEASSWSVRRLGTWSGLLDAPNGRPGVTLFAREAGGWTGPLTLLDGNRATVAAETELSFRWFADEAAARAWLAAPAPGARWGIEDGPRLIWFESFTAGTGTVLSDGRDVELLAGAPPESLRVRIGDQVQTVPPGGADAVHYQAPSSDVPVVRLAGYESGSILVRAGSGPVTRAAAGDPLDAAGVPGWAVVNIAASAVAVAAEDSPLLGVLLEAGEALRWLPEERATMHGDRVLELACDRPPPAVTYRAELAAGDAHDLRRVEPGDTLRRQGWVLRVALPDVRLPGALRVEARRRLPWAYAAAGAMAALLGLATLRYEARRVGRPPTA